jgi:hypothetical protein
MLATLHVADSIFIGYVEPIKSVLDARLYQKSLKKEHSLSAHIPYCWIVVGDGDTCESGFDEDGEPLDSVGPILNQELRRYADCQGGNYVIAVVRYFGHRLLGVSCGRLPQCYGSVAKRALHRYFHKEQPFHVDFTKTNLTKSMFGLGAGDCEIILDILKDVTCNSLTENSDANAWINEILGELEFDGFKGNRNEELPRLQNLQADLSSGVIPCYRYPGNYRGDEWETYEWSPLSYKVKKAVEKNLGPFSGQEMNHCVTNYYRDGFDYIGHHSDKDLDLDKEGVIVSVSLGDERILELKRKDHPQDSYRFILPHGSMLILGPWTNKYFTHSIVQKEGSTQPRISLTFRRVLTFLDTRSGRLFGEGVTTKTLSELRNLEQWENIYFAAGLGSFVSVALQMTNKANQKCISTGVVATGLVVLTYVSFRKVTLFWKKRKEEHAARAFFSNASVHGTKY